MQAAHRWAFYALAALGTAGAMAWVERREAEVIAPPVPPASRAAATVWPGATAKALAAARPTALPQRRYTEPLGDPFSPDEAPAVAVLAQAQAVPVAGAAPSLAAPALPYVYLGRWVENGSTVAFLSTPQGINVAARAGATLDGSYLVESIDREGIAFKYLPLGQRQRLAFEQVPAAAAPASPPGDQVRAAVPADSEESN